MRNSSNNCTKNLSHTRLAIVTNFPSYHNVDLFNALAQHPEITLKVFYLRHITPGRKWKRLREIKHSHEFIKEWTISSQIYINHGLIFRLRRFGPDVSIITQYASVSMQILMYYGLIFQKNWLFWSEAPGVKFTEHEIVKNQKLRQFLRKLALLPIRIGARQIWAIGEHARKMYHSFSDVDSINVPYYFNQDKFLSIDRHGDKSREDNLVKFIFSGKQVYRKGFDVLLEAVQILDSLQLPFQVYVMGETPDLTKLTVSSIQERIKYLGFRELDEVPRVYAICDVLVFPSRYDGWGMTVAEAMASGMPVISSDAVGCAQDTIVDGYNGFTFQNGDSTALAEHMRYFIEYPEEIIDMGKKARESVQPYSHYSGAEKFITLLTDLTQLEI